MRAPMRATAAALLIVLAGCSVKLEGAGCSDDTNCPSGQRCGFDGTCRTGAVRYEVTLAAPASGAVVGPSGITLQVTVVRASGIPDSGNPTLVAGGTNFNCSSNGPPGPTSATYNCSYAPPAGIDKTVSAVASAGSGADVSQSAPVDLVVDTVPPVLGAVTFQCSATPCTRDATLTVSATATDTHLSAVSASIGPGALATVNLVQTTGSTYQATVPPNQLKFPFYEQDLTATVAAIDAAGNSASSSGSIKMTRLRWSVPVESSNPPALTGAAIDASGKAYFGASNGNVYVVDLTAQPPGVSKWSPVASAAISAPPALGASTLWVGSQDGKVYAVSVADGSIQNGSGCNINNAWPVVATPAVAPAAGLVAETAYVGSQGGGASAQNGVFCAVRVAGCFPGSVYGSQSFKAAPVVDGSGKIYAAGGSTLHGFEFLSTTWQDDWTTSVGAVTAPLALDGLGHIWTATSDSSGSLDETDPSASTPAAVNRASLGSALGAPVVIDASRNIVVGDQAGVLHKLSPAGTSLWTTQTPPNLGAPIISALVLTGGDADYVVPTTSGTLAGVKSDGSFAWQSGQLTATANPSLNEPNIVKLPGDTFSTAIFGAADGKVYAVIVDGQLANAPWPKAHHDPRNTGNAATQLP